jgi:hypothetical protein
MAWNPFRVSVYVRRYVQWHEARCTGPRANTPVVIVFAAGLPDTALASMVPAEGGCSPPLDPYPRIQGALAPDMILR